jgi:hypothetical protein
LYGAETWILVGGRSEMWCWRRIEKISWADRVRNGVLQRVKENRTFLSTIKMRKAKWIGHILRRNCLLEHVIEERIKGRIEVTGRRGRRGKQLLCDLKGMRGYSKLKKEALARTLWRIRLRRDYGTVVRHKTKTKLNSVALVRERTIPTERPPPVGEVSANFCG